MSEQTESGPKPGEDSTDSSLLFTPQSSSCSHNSNKTEKDDKEDTERSQDPESSEHDSSANLFDNESSSESPTIEHIDPGNKSSCYFDRETQRTRAGTLSESIKQELNESVTDY